MFKYQMKFMYMKMKKNILMLTYFYSIKFFYLTIKHFKIIIDMQYAL